MPYSSPVVSPKSGLVEHQACMTAVGAVTNTECVMDTAVTHQQVWWHSPPAEIPTLNLLVALCAVCRLVAAPSPRVGLSLQSHRTGPGLVLTPSECSWGSNGWLSTAKYSISLLKTY